MASTQNTFASKLTAARERAGLSQYALANKAGLSKQALSRLEQGASEPTWETVQRLALALGVDCREFVDQGLVLQETEEGRGRGRPKKEGSTPTPAPPPTAQGVDAQQKPKRGKTPRKVNEQPSPVKKPRRKKGGE